MQRGVRRGGAANREDHPPVGVHLSDRAVKASRPRRTVMRGIVAAALTGLALSGLVMVPGAARAEAPLETPDSDDVLTVTKTTSDQTITVNGIPYRLVLYGFVPNADGNCPATPPAGSTPVSTFTTKESQASFGCLYGSFSQERYVRVAKAVTEDSEQVGDVIPPCTFTTMGLGDWAAPTGTPLTTSVTPDGFVGWNSFEDANLTPTAYGEAGAVSSGYRAFMPGFSQFIIAETGPRIAGRFPLDFGAQGRFGPWKTSDDPNSAQWSLADVTCLNGVGERVNVTRDATTGGVDFSQVAPASSPAAMPITCTFTNREQVPKLRIQKELESVEGATTDDITVTYRITATNDGTLAPPTDPHRKGWHTAGWHAQRRRHVSARRSGLRDLRQRGLGWHPGFYPRWWVAIRDRAPRNR